jgi:hypothetical protein
MFAPNDSGVGTILRKTLWQQCFLGFAQKTRHLTLRQNALSNQRDSPIFKPNPPALETIVLDRQVRPASGQMSDVPIFRGFLRIRRS